MKLINVNDINLNEDIIIDIRQNDEFNRENINGALNITPENLKNNLKDIDENKTIIFHCQSGNRTKQNEKLFESLGFKNSFILEGGLNAWKNYGKKTNVNLKAPFPIMRQVQIIVGFMVIIGVILSLIINPYFSLISAFFGLGLLFAGISGYCGLANVLMFLPYNKNK